jgi:hypothetical protein
MDVTYPAVPNVTLSNKDFVFLNAEGHHLFDDVEEAGTDAPGASLSLPFGQAEGSMFESRYKNPRPRKNTNGNNPFAHPDNRDKLHNSEDFKVPVHSSVPSTPVSRADMTMDSTPGSPVSPASIRRARIVTMPNMPTRPRVLNLRPVVRTLTETTERPVAPTSAAVVNCSGAFPCAKHHLKNEHYE